MNISGRTPKPTALKLLQGNPGGRPLNQSEPKPVSKAVCPSHLNTLARKEWRRISTELETLGLLTGVDATVLASYCVAYGRWVEAEKRVQKEGMVLTTATTVKQNPSLVIANNCMLQMHKFCVEFGMTPASRSRVHASPPAKEADPFEAFMADIGGIDLGKNDSATQ